MYAVWILTSNITNIRKSTIFSLFLLCNLNGLNWTVQRYGPYRFYAFHCIVTFSSFRFFKNCWSWTLDGVKFLTWSQDRTLINSVPTRSQEKLICQRELLWYWFSPLKPNKSTIPVSIVPTMTLHYEFSYSSQHCTGTIFPGSNILF